MSTRYGAMVYGDLVCHRTGTACIRIIEAGPRIRISAELLPLIYTHPAPGVSLTLPPPGRWPFDRVAGYWEGAVLRIDDGGRAVVYRIGRWDPRWDLYEAEWPD